MIGDVRSFAAQTARAVALIITDTAGRLSLAAQDGLAIRGQVYLVSAIQAPRLATIADVAAMCETLAGTIATMVASADPADAVQPLYDAAAASAYAAPAFASPAKTRMAALGRTIAASTEATFLGHAFVMQANAGFADRPAAIAARKRIAAAMDASLDRIAQNTGLAVVDLLGEVARTASAHIADVAANLQPIVRVQTAKSAPSSALAFRLYGDPSRAPELVARNRVATPIFMPTTIDALAPGA